MKLAKRNFSWIKIYRTNILRLKIYFNLSFKHSNQSNNNLRLNITDSLVRKFTDLSVDRALKLHNPKWCCQCLLCDEPVVINSLNQLAYVGVNHYLRTENLRHFLIESEVFII